MTFVRFLDNLVAGSEELLTDLQAQRATDVQKVLK